MSDVEVVRKVLMMRDAGYEPTDVWEQVASLLKEHDRLRVANDHNESVIRICNQKISEVERWNADLRAALAEAEKTIECNHVALKEAGIVTTQLHAALAEAEREREKDNARIVGLSAGMQLLISRAERAAASIAEAEARLPRE